MDASNITGLQALLDAKANGAGITLSINPDTNNLVVTWTA
jgi:hypothetical protein